jgi:exopolysaccharide biosynthesis WecB/TagA/CpsF family protein
MVHWPRKYDLFGVQISATTYEEATELILGAARRHMPAAVSLHAVHAVITASQDSELRDEVNHFEIVAPDGQPVRWALNLLYGTGLSDRVRGPELMLRLCRGAAEQQIPIYLYGSLPPVLDALCASLSTRFPGILIVGAESPPFRDLTEEEEDAVVQRVNATGAGLLFLGLGCPKQDRVAHRFQGRIHGVVVCVGAAFDFHAGTKRMAPRWMQRWGLEWLHRLCSEPRRLGKRYLVTNAAFLKKLTAAFVAQRWPRRQASEPGRLPNKPR